MSSTLSGPTTCQTALSTIELCPESLTWHAFSRIHIARANSHEQNSLAFVKRIILCNGNIDSSFADGVRSSISDIDLVDKIYVRHASRQGEDFLLSTFAEERDEGVDGVDRADDVDVEADLEVLDQDLGIMGAAIRWHR